MTDNRNTILAVHSVRPCADCLAIFLQRPADGEAAHPAADPRPSLAKPTRRRPGSTTPQAQYATRRPVRLRQISPPPRRRSLHAIPRLPPARIKVSTPRLSGSISLKGARIDDLALIQFRRPSDRLRRLSFCSRHWISSCNRNLWAWVGRARSCCPAYRDRRREPAAGQADRA